MNEADNPGTILIISPEGWEAHFVSKHHYARVLAASGRNILFLNPPDESLTTLEISDTEYKGIRVVRSPRLALGLRFWPGSLRRWLERRWLEKLEHAADCVIGTIWLFENSRFFDFRFAGSRLKIYHQVDLNQRFNQPTAARTADICFCTTDHIAQDLLRYAPRVHKIHHGTAISPHLEDRRASPKNNHMPVATYIGNLDMTYLDWRALARLIEDNDGVTFNLVGAYTNDTPLRKRVGNAPNVKWWGKLPFSDLPPILSASDVLLVSYLKQYHDDQASPHKFMEYLYSGKTIVCSYTDEYKDKRHLVEMAEPDQEIDEVFSRVIADLATYNSSERQAERRGFALDHRYENQVARIAEHVSQDLGRQF